MKKGKQPNVAAANWHTLSIQETFDHFPIPTNKGWTERSSCSQKTQYGLNEIEAQLLTSVFTILLRQFTDFMILVLLAVVAGFVGEISDTFLSFSSYCVAQCSNRFYQEYKAEQAMNALEKNGRS